MAESGHKTAEELPDFLQAAIDAGPYDPTANKWASQSVRIVDLGVIDFAKVFTEGPQTLYTMAEGEFLRSLTLIDKDWEVPANPPWWGTGALSPAIGTRKSLGWQGFVNANDLLEGFSFGREAAKGGGVGQLPSAIAQLIPSPWTDGPIEAAIINRVGEGPEEPIGTPGEGIGYRVAPIVTWKAHTAYDKAREEGAGGPGGLASPQRTHIVANGIIWRNVGESGESGEAEPEFAGHEVAGETVSEGSLTWECMHPDTPLTGKVHAVAEIWTPS